MCLQVKMAENDMKNVFRYKETTKKVPIKFLDAKVLPKM